ncbi:MAG: cell surface protein SprA, partial [Acidimicrobiia bacterium]|nr:cell surface protein SprA [Acidimicrobiia bacterium]
IMRLSQKSATDKFRIGEEPIANTVWGVDGRLNLEPRWLTRAVDALPFLQTRAPSSISVTGEFAQLRPGHTQTNAFDQAQRDLQNLDGDRDFSKDQINGISYIDDFESFENTYSLLQPGFWRLSSSPAVIDAVDPLDFEADSLRTTWRAAFAWYQLNPSIRNTLNDQGVAITPAVQGVRPQDVFPNRETTSSDRTLTPLDLYFDPRQRGPYNYTTELDQFLLNPKQTWGGMIQRVPEGYTDFSLKNIEFVEFVMQVPENSAGRDAKLYVDLGVISEEVIPDNQPNLEDGLSLANLPIDDVRWARLSGTTQNKLINIAENDRLTEDVGLDGFASFQPNDFVESLTENFQFADFLASLEAIEAQGVDPSIRPFFEREKAKALIDPSGDDYRYFADDDFFRNPAFYPNGSLLQERFLYYFPSPELNAIETQSRLGNTQGNSRTPDTEDLNLNSASDDTDRYFEYQLPLNQDSLATLADPSRIDDYVIEEIKDNNGVGRGWYLVRIPVQNFTRRIGNVQDFSLIESIRIWTSGHEQPVTIRFAAMELVGSQWRESDDVAVDVAEGLRSTAPVDPAFGDPVDPLSTETRLTVSSINNFENDYLSPYGTIVTQIRQTTGAANVQAREQALVLRTENLRAGQQRAIFKTYQALDLLKYSNLRMFVHMHGELQDGTDLVELANRNLAEAREKARLFVRLGANEANDYYEYEQPLTPSDPLSNDPDTLWQTNRLFNGETRDLNSLNIELSALNQLKFARDENEAVPTDVIFWNDRNDRDPTNDIALEPSLDTFAPPGTRIGIKGTPSLNRINTIVIGIRNPDGSEHVLEDVTIWVNELRASGYDERTGWSGLMNANIQLADFAQVKGNFQLQTDGFGALSSTLDDRDQRELQDWAINTQVSLDKFIPE